MNFERWYRLQKSQGQGELAILPLPGDDPLSIQVERSDGIASVWVLRGDQILAWPPPPCEGEESIAKQT